MSPKIALVVTGMTIREFVVWVWERIRLQEAITCPDDVVLLYPTNVLVNDGCWTLVGRDSEQTLVRYIAWGDGENVLVCACS